MFRFPAFVLALIVSVYVCACAEDGPSSNERELEAIDRLHKRDMAAAKSGDFETLRSLLSEDAVMMPPGQQWIRGAEALDENRRRSMEAMLDVEVLDYRLDFEEVVVLGEYAYE